MTFYEYVYMYYVYKHLQKHKSCIKVLRINDLWLIPTLTTYYMHGLANCQVVFFLLTR